MLRITKENMEQCLKEVYIHDCDMVSIKQDLEEHRVEIYMENHYTDVMKRYTITFLDALYFESSNYSPWFSGYQVNTMWCEAPTLFSRLINLPDEWGTGDHTNLPESNVDFIQSSIQFRSGDRIRILCKAVEVEEAPL